MSYSEIFLLAVSLGMDAFAVSAGAGMIIKEKRRRSMLRMAFSFGLFQFIMPIVGWRIGISAVSYLREFNKWAVFAVLVFLGSKMIYEAFWIEEKEHEKNPSKGMTLLVLSVATSIDALAAGFGIAVLGGGVILSAVIIGIIAFIMSVAGFVLGDRVGEKLDMWAEVVAGVILIGLGVKVLI